MYPLQRAPVLHCAVFIFVSSSSSSFQMWVWCCRSSLISGSFETDHSLWILVFPYLRYPLGLHKCANFGSLLFCILFTCCFQFYYYLFTSFNILNLSRYLLFSILSHKVSPSNNVRNLCISRCQKQVKNTRLSKRLHWIVWFTS